MGWKCKVPNSQLAWICMDYQYSRFSFLDLLLIVFYLLFLKTWKVKDEESTTINFGSKNLQKLGYEFHIDQKTRNEVLQISVFSSKGIPITHQHTDSHPCIRPGWSRSLSEWSRPAARWPGQASTGEPRKNKEKQRRTMDTRGNGGHVAAPWCQALLRKPMKTSGEPCKSFDVHGNLGHVPRPWRRISPRNLLTQANVASPSRASAKKLRDDLFQESYFSNCHFLNSSGGCTLATCDENHRMKETPVSFSVPRIVTGNGNAVWT